MKTEDFVMMPIPVSAFTAVCALLGGASTIAVASRPAAQPAAQPQPELQAAPDAAKAPAEAPAAAAAEEVQHDPNDIDTGGHPWSAELHASTRNKTKDGYWRMKVGVARPAPLPGFPKPETGAGATGTSGNGTGASAGAAATESAADPATGTAAVEDDDEFAAFRAASERVNATDNAAAASIPARKWTDGDLGSLCNQAAVKLGDPTPIKEIIAQFVPAGQVAHSRMIPEDKREEFAQAVEAKAGITFVG